jgi:hypothetical protein
LTEANSRSNAILIAGAMISAAVYLRPGELPDVEGEYVGGVVSEDADDEPQGAEAVVRAMHGDNLVPIELEGWDPPADGIYTKDDLRRLLDAWEKHWPNSNDECESPFRQHGGVI